MTRRLGAVLFGLSLMAVSLPLPGSDGPGEEGPKQSFEVTSTERVNFPPGGTVILENSYGYLTVEGWDEPAVEITVTKTTDRFYEPGRKAKAERHFDEIRVAAERHSDKELAISTSLPLRKDLVSSILPERRVIVTLPVRSERGVTVECRLHVPRDSRLVVHHDNGYVWVSDVTGELELNSHTGDMIVMLSDPGRYSIDAGTRLGSISSDFTGRAHTQFLLGTHFVHGPAEARRIYLRMGRGNITIKAGPPSVAWGKN